MDGFLTNWEIQRAFGLGLLMTLKLSGISIVLALLLGVLTSFARSSGVAWLRIPASLYIQVFRNTPLLIQLYFYYRGLQSVGIMLSPETCGILALSLYTGAYLAEIFRSGLLAIPQEQMDAGLSLGLNRLRVYQLVLIPQMVRLVLPAVGNQAVSLIKNSSLVAFITVSDLFYVIYKGAVDHFMPVPYFLEGALLYLMLSLAVSVLIAGLERMLKRSWLPGTDPEVPGYA